MCIYHLTQAAGLTLTLQSKYSANTIIAPTNEAFDSLFKRLDVSQAELFADTAKIAEVRPAGTTAIGTSLQYHMIAGISIGVVAVRTCACASSCC